MVPAATAAAQRAGGRPYLAGIVAGTWVVLALVATGVTTLLLALPTATAGDADVPAPRVRGGLLLGVANPKAWVAIAAAFASAPLEPAEKTAVLAAVVVAVNAAWLAAGASLAPLLRSRAANVALAAVLVVATAAAVVR